MNGTAPFGPVAAHIVMYGHDFFLEEAVACLAPRVDRILIARTTRPWNGSPDTLRGTEEALNRLQARYGDRLEIYSDEFPSQHAQRNFLLTLSRARGDRGALIVDCDEIFSGEALPRVLAFVATHRPSALRIPYRTFVKDASFCVGPPYETNLFYVDLTCRPRFLRRRTCDQPETVMPYPDPEILHFSYIRETEEDILAKVQHFSAARDTDWRAWYVHVYQRFHPRLRNFHPVTPEAWSHLLPFDLGRLPAALAEKLRRFRKVPHATWVAGRAPLRLNLGCGRMHLPDHVNIDLYNPAADLALDITDLRYFEDGSATEILAKAVLEHLPVFAQEVALAEWHRVLAPGGRLWIRSLPDFDQVIAAYRRGGPGHVGPRFDADEAIRYLRGPYNAGDWAGQLHKDIFTQDKLRRLLEGAGFEQLRLENVCAPGEANPVNLEAEAVKGGRGAPRKSPEPVWAGAYPGEADWLWMSERAELTLWLPTGGGPRRLRMRVSCGEAAHYSSFPFCLRVGEGARTVQTLRFERSGQAEEVVVPLPEEGGPVRVRFESDASFVPREQGAGPDDRRLALQAGPPRVEVTGEERGETGTAGWLAAGDRAAQCERWAEACGAYIEALTRQRDCAEARAGLGLALLAQGEVEEGLAQLEEGVRLRPTPDLVADLASGLLAAGRTAEGERLLRGVLAADPGHVAARANLAALEAAMAAGAGCGPIDEKGEERCGS